MKIRIDDLQSPAIHALLNEHLQNMYELSPPESVHALNLEKLREPDITFWAAWENDSLLGCGALKELDPTHGELKSMHTAEAARRQGVGRAMVDHLLALAAARGYQRVSLETGTMAYFAPARALYADVGFIVCEPFGEYTTNPHSVCMSLTLPPTARSI